jgi:hypothetical protein
VTDDAKASGREHPVERPRSRLFSIRVWKEQVAGGSEYRGTVRDVARGAFRSSRDWSDLAGFVVERMAEDEDAPL